MMALLAVSMRLHLIQRCVYKGKDNTWKLKPEEYILELFEAYAETPDECRHILESRMEQKISLEEAEYCHRCLWKIAKFIGPMLSCSGELLFAHEFAFTIDYVIRRQGDVEDPVFADHCPFPVNYDDFDYTTGVAEILEEFLVWT